MVSTANDLLKFLSTVMGYEDSKLAPSMAALLQTRRPAGGHEQALGWWIIGTGDDAIVFHDGGSFGFSSSLAWQPQRRVGVVVLSNQTYGCSRHCTPSAATEPAAGTAEPRASHGDHARRGGSRSLRRPLRHARRRRRRDRAGEGAAADDRAARRAGACRSCGCTRKSEREFFTTELPLQATFEVDADGRVTGMLVHPPRGQRTIPARRL